MHHNTPRFNNELKATRIPRFGPIGTHSVLGSQLLYVSETTATFLTFGGSSDSFIFTWDAIL
jgi:hypothetical protein